MAANGLYGGWSRGLNISAVKSIARPDLRDHAKKIRKYWIGFYIGAGVSFLPVVAAIMGFIIVESYEWIILSALSTFIFIAVFALCLGFGGYF